MTREELMTKRRAAEAFCAEHIIECTQELIEWQDTAILRSGRVRELGALCTEYMGNHDGLRGAERMIERQACEIVAAQRDVERDAARLDYVLSNDAFIVAVGVTHKSRYQLWNQDEDENHHVLSGPGDYATRREAIDAAMSHSAHSADGGMRGEG